MFRCVTKQIECNMFVCCVSSLFCLPCFYLKMLQLLHYIKIANQIMVIHKVLFWKVFYVDQREKKA